MSITWRKCVKCGLTRAADTNVTYHRFPNPGKASIGKAQAWAKFCWPEKDWSSLESLRALHFGSKILCGRHFLNSQFIDENRQKLCKHAYPTVTDMEYHKAPKQVKQETKVTPMAIDELDTETEYLLDWETLEDETYIHEDSVAMDEQARVKIEPQTKIVKDVKNKSNIAKAAHVTPKTKAVKKEPNSVNTKNDKKESSIANAASVTPKTRAVKNEPNSVNNNNVKKESYIAMATPKTSTVEKKPQSVNVKNDKKEKNVIQDMNKNPVLDEIVKRALSKTGITIKRVPKTTKEQKPKELNIKISGVCTRNSAVGKNNNNKPKNASKAKPISNAEQNIQGGNESLKTALFSFDDDDDIDDGIYDDIKKECSDEDYDPNDESEVDSDGERKDDTEWDKVTVKSDKRETRFGPCRCCLKEGEHAEVDVLDTLSCLNIHPSSSADLSSLVCAACADFLHRVTEFRNMVATSEVELTSRAHLYTQEFEHIPETMDEDSQGVNETADEDLSEIERDENRSFDENMATESGQDVEFEEEGDTQSYIDDDDATAEDTPSPSVLRRIRDPNPRSREILKTLRQNVVTIIMNSTILPFTYNRNPMLINHYECIHHDARFTEFHNLRAHMQKCHTTLDEKYIVSFVSLLQKGILRADISDLRCRTCDLKVSNLNELVHHLVTEHGVKYKNMNWDPPHNILAFDLGGDVLKCPACEKEFTTFRGLLAHMNMHYGSFLCPLCGMKFLYPDTFSKHKRKHREVLPVKSVICDQCGINLTSRKALELHKKKICDEKPVKRVQVVKTPKKIHVNVESYNCRLCGAECESGRELFSHRLEHLKECQDKIHACEVCKYTATSKSSMIRHFKRHYGVKDVSCKVCNKGFVTIADLKLHSKVHLARFQCPFCLHLFFTSKRECVHHMRTEHGDKILKESSF